MTLFRNMLRHSVCVFLCERGRERERESVVIKTKTPLCSHTLPAITPAYDQFSRLRWTLKKTVPPDLSGIQLGLQWGRLRDPLKDPRRFSRPLDH